MDPEENAEILIYAEFITSLKVANIYIGFKEETKSYGIREIICEPDKIRVKFRKRAGYHCREPTADSEKTFSADLPASIRLRPDTCSSLQPTPFGWLLRLNIQEVHAGADITFNNKKDGDAAFHPKCRTCGNAVLKSDMANGITAFVPLSQMGMPSDTDWDRIDLSYFCHNHNHLHSDGLVTASDKQLTAFVPKPNEAFIGHTSYVLNAKCVQLPSPVSSTKTDQLKCSRCHFTLGTTFITGFDDEDIPIGTIQLYTDAVVSQGNSNCSVNLMLGKFLKECCNSCRRLCISLKDQSNDALSLFIWIMDWNLKIFNTQTNEQMPDSHQQSVCKVLYKQESPDSIQGKQWLADSSVKKVTLHQSLLVTLISTLLKSTKTLPLAWRYANDFCVGYL